MIYYSVKQKLCQLYPNNQPNNKLLEDEKSEQEVGVSVDDTLRSTSPLPENEEMPVVDLYNHSEEVQQSPESDSSGDKKRMLLRSNSYTLEKPSVALLIAERVSVSPIMCSTLIVQIYLCNWDSAGTV